MKKIIAFILVVVSLFSAMSISAYAENTNENTVTVNGVEFIFVSDTSEDFRRKAIAHYFSSDDDSASAYGLICTLFGHDIETSVVTTVTHKAKATDPRCLRERYKTETCTRCDYANAVLIDSTYISCC